MKLSWINQNYDKILERDWSSTARFEHCTGPQMIPDRK